MLIKRKLPILTFLALIFSLIVTVFPTNSAYADEEDRILDIYGDPITTNKDYILINKYWDVVGVHPKDRIAPVGQNRFGVTYEKYAGWHYAIQYRKASYYGSAEIHKDAKGNEYYGTPINFETPDGLNSDGYIRHNTPVTMSMWIGGPNAEAGGVKKYINAKDAGWIYFSDQSKSKSIVQKVNSKEINLATGTTEILRDKFGRPCDWYSADPKNSYYGVTSTFQVQIAQYPGSDHEKMWAISAPQSVAGYELVPLQ